MKILRILMRLIGIGMTGFAELLLMRGLKPGRRKHKVEKQKDRCKKDTYKFQNITVLD